MITHVDSGESRRKFGVDFLAALQFLTIIPLHRDVTQKELGRSLAYFPLVGLGIGAALFGLDRLFILFLPAALGMLYSSWSWCYSLGRITSTALSIPAMAWLQAGRHKSDWISCVIAGWEALG